jgi:hypothetical protein
MLKQIERDPSAFIQSHNLAVYKGTGWKPFGEALLNAIRLAVRQEIGEAFTDE